MINDVMTSQQRQGDVMALASQTVLILTGNWNRFSYNKSTNIVATLREKKSMKLKFQ